MKPKYNQNTLKYTSNKNVSNIKLGLLSTRSMQNLFLLFIEGVVRYRVWLM